ncbi:hypothetical protein ABGB16_31505 [Micromonospora sp. B11E3]
MRSAGTCCNAARTCDRPTEQVHANAEAGAWQPTDEDLDALDALL